MSPEERDLIASVFQRLERVANAPKDAQAQELIADYMRRQPDAAYGLVQAVLVQENALKAAQARIADLESRAQTQPAAGGFLPQSGNPWAQSQPQPQQQQAFAPPQQQQQPQPWAQQQPQAWGQPQSSGGSFLRTAAQTAAGVAGGILVAEGISSLFSGHHGGFGGGFGSEAAFNGRPEVIENTTVNNYYGSDAQPSQQANWQSADTGYDDSSYGDTGSDDTWM